MPEINPFIAIPPPPILQSALMTKGEVYDFLISEMIAAGWEDIASNPGVEGNVMHSTGEAGDKDIYVQIRPIIGNSPTTAITPATDWRSSAVSGIGIRLLPDYTPGDPGVSGTASKNVNLIVGHMFKTSMAVTVADVPVYYYVDKDIAIFYIRVPDTLTPATYIGGLIAFGLPKDGIGDRDAQRDTFLVITTAAAATGSQTANTVNVLNNPAGAGDNAAIINETAYINHPPLSIDFKGRYLPVAVFYGDATYGYRGMLPGIFVLNANIINSIVEGDILNDLETGYKYKVFEAPGLAVSALGATNLIACSRIE
jgi:hypothetical protein